MKIAILSSLVFFSSIVFSQTFDAFPFTFIPSNRTITSTIDVTGVGSIGCVNGLVEVCIDIDHTFDADLDIFLIDPLGATYELTTDNGGGGDNYSITCFDMSAATSVTAGSAPFNGSFIPEGDFTGANDGRNADGTWTLSVTDDAGGDTGTLFSWSIRFGEDPPCNPPVIEDCWGGTTLCSDATFTGNSSGSGNVADLSAANDGCLDGEHESSWYYFQAAADGSYAFEIVTAVDYDFAVWGPFAEITCPPNTPPLRCSYSGTPGTTGLRAGSGDNSEGSGGDAFVDPIVASEDDIFILVIDNFTSDGTSFDLEFTLTGGGVLDCTPLPIELLSFEGEAVNEANQLEWVTASELNNAFFTLERSLNGIDWVELDRLQGAGNSAIENKYSYKDRSFNETLNYYRLSQTDFDGKETVVKTITIDNFTNKKVVKIVNMLGQQVDEFYEGIKIYTYSDGTTRKVLHLN